MTAATAMTNRTAMTAATTHPDPGQTAVVIAGAGPVGLMLACELGLAGVPVTVIEPLTERSPRAPGVAVNAGLVEVLDDRGLMEPLREETFILPAVHFSLMWLDLMGQPRQPHADAYMLPQSRLEEHLEERATALGAQIRRGQRVTGFEQDSAGVTVSVSSDDGTGYRLRARYLVGCDGTDSTVRARAGIGFTGVEDDRCWGIVGDIAFDPDEMEPEHFGARLAPDGGVYMGAPAAEGLLRVTTFDWRDAEAPPVDQPVPVEEFHATVLRITGHELRGEPLWLKRYRNVTRQAQAYRCGRVFLAGDAAHTVVPLNGLAMCAGIQDAANLGWKLAASVAGWAPPGLLDTYEAERMPAGRKVCRDTQAQAELFHPPARVGPLREIIGELMQFDEVRRYLVRTVSGLGVNYVFDDAAAASHPLLGTRLPQVPLKCGNGEVFTYELLHAGRAVLLDVSGEPEPARDAATAAVRPAQWRGRLEFVVAAPAPEIEAGAVLIRPDGYVAWVGNGSGPKRFAGLRQALEQWLGEPAE